MNKYQNYWRLKRKLYKQNKTFIICIAIFYDFGVICF